MKHPISFRFWRSLLALMLAVMLPFNALAGTFTLPAAIKHVGDQAFMNTDVDTVVLPDGTPDHRLAGVCQLRCA